MKIAVIQPKMIGDVLITSVIFEELKLKFPTAELHFIVNKNTTPVLENNPFIDKIITLDPSTERGFFGFIKQLNRIRVENYDIIIDSYSKLKTALFCKFSLANKTISFNKSYSKFFYNDTIIRTKHSISTATKAVEHRLQLLKPLEIDFQVIKPKLYLENYEIEEAIRILTQNNIDLNKPIIMISAIGSSESKTYPLHHMANVIDQIAENKSVQILFNYIPNQKNTAFELYNLCQLDTQEQIFFDVYAKSLREFMGLTSQCAALIGNEGGAINMAKALNIPTFTIFSPFILKNDWNMFENEKTNISVHISDYFPNLSLKKSKNDTEIYELLKPELFNNLLLLFLKNNSIR
ncbi:MAG: glycosyltransferase family 9 protein [Flavobacterium sp.]|nr:glycosyltransferase family 9 protein [Flavobacterium sp.]